MRQVINKLMTKFDPGCEAISRTSSVSMDRPLTLKERLELTTHLLMCGFCRRYHRQLLAIRKMASNLSHDDSSEQPEISGLDEEARQRIKRAIDPSAED